MFNCLRVILPGVRVNRLKWKRGHAGVRHVSTVVTFSGVDFPTCVGVLVCWCGKKEKKHYWKVFLACNKSKVPFLWKSSSVPIWHTGPLNLQVTHRALGGGIFTLFILWSCQWPERYLSVTLMCLYLFCKQEWFKDRATVERYQEDTPILTCFPFFYFIKWSFITFLHSKLHHCRSICTV